MVYKIQGLTVLILFTTAASFLIVEILVLVEKHGSALIEYSRTSGYCIDKWKLYGCGLPYKAFRH